MTDLDDLLDAEVEVGPSTGSSPRLVQAVVALVVGGLLIGLLVSAILVGLSAIAPDPDPVGKLCGGAASCAVPFVGTGSFE